MLIYSATNEEIFVCLDGEGIITIDGKESSFKKHDVAFLAPLSEHSIRATSEEPLKLMVIISPTDRLTRPSPASQFAPLIISMIRSDPTLVQNEV